MRRDSNKLRRRSERRDADIRKKQAFIARAHQGGLSQPYALPFQVETWPLLEVLRLDQEDLTWFLVARRSPQGRVATVKFAFKSNIGFRGIEARTFHSQDGYEMLWRDSFGAGIDVIVSDLETVLELAHQALAGDTEERRDLKAVHSILGV